MDSKSCRYASTPAGGAIIIDVYFGGMGAGGMGAGHADRRDDEETRARVAELIQAFGWRAPRIAEPPALRRAVSASRRCAGLRRSGERGKQIAQVRLVRGTAQHGTDLEDLFDRPQRRAVVIVVCVLVTHLRVRREDHHADRPVLRVAGRGAAFALVPGDEDHATLLVGGGIE